VRRGAGVRGVVVLAAVLGTALLWGTGASGQPTAKAEIPAKVRPELLKVALNAAAKGGDRHPYDIQAVRAPDNVKFTPPKAPGREDWVYFIAMHGQFRKCPKVHGAKGGPTSEGGPSTYSAHEAVLCEDVLEITVLASTLEPLFVSYSCNYPDLGSHGTPVRLGPAIKAPANLPPGRHCEAPPTLEEIP
jgi:hypothetical protein